MALKTDIPLFTDTGEGVALLPGREIRVPTPVFIANRLKM